MPPAGRLDTAALALAGALPHAVNHALFRCSWWRGRTRTGTRSLKRWADRSGDARDRDFFFAERSRSLAPPLNGFVSEF
jgi:hypothetical protein